MLTKWSHARPTKFHDYLTLPSRWDLMKLLRGNYNYCWSYQQVADAVAQQYATADRHLRAEMVTSQIIAHRTGRMVSGFDGWDTTAVVANLMAIPAIANKSTITTYEWDNERQRAVLTGGPRPIGEAQ